MHHLIHSAEHAFFESIKLVPVLFIVYFIIEYFEHKNNNSFNHILMKSRRTGPFVGALLGCVPQCGFSVIAANLYSKRTITLGTLIAVFVATSDEAIPILLSNTAVIGDIGYVLLCKFVVAIISGFIIDTICKTVINKSNVCHDEHHHEHYHGNCESCDDGILSATIKHTLKIFLFVFLANLVIGCFIGIIGEDKIKAVLTSNMAIQPFLSSLVGLIPNCAASCVITEMYAEGVLSFGALIGGLSTGAGVGTVVLFKLNKPLKQNALIVALVYIIGVISGTVIQFLVI